MTRHSVLFIAARAWVRCIRVPRGSESLLARDDHVRQRRPPAESPRGVLSRDGHGGDPPQKLARHHNALVTERERSGARNGVGKVVVPAGRVVDAIPTAARRPAFQPAELR